MKRINFISHCRPKLKKENSISGLRKENFTGSRKRGKSSRASPPPHHTECLFRRLIFILLRYVFAREEMINSHLEDEDHASRRIILCKFNIIVSYSCCFYLLFELKCNQHCNQQCHMPIN